MEKDNAHIWYERARCDMQLGRYHQAERGFKVAIGLEPDTPLPYRELANIYEFAYEQRKKAEEVLKNGLLQTGEAYLLLIELGEFYERKMEYDSARAYYSSAAKMAPDDPEAFISLGALLKEEGKISEFFSFINSQFDTFKDHEEFLINSGKIIWEIAREREMDDVYLEQALTYMERGIRKTTANLKEALEWYIGLVEDAPFYRRGIEFLEEERVHRDDDFPFLCYIGYIYEQNGYLNKAKRYQADALNINEDILPLYRLGEIHFKLEEYEVAKEFYQKVLTLDPYHEQAMLDLAGIASLEENKTEELHYLMEAFRIDPTSVSIEAILYLMDEPSMVEDFLQKFKELDQTRYDQAFLYDSMAYIYGKLGDLKAEEDLLLRALEHSPELPQLLHHQVKLFFKKGKRRKAKKRCLQLIQKNFTRRELYVTLIDIYSKTMSIPQLSTDLKKMKLNKKEKSIIFMNGAAAYEKAANLIEKTSVNKRKGLINRLISTTKLSFHLGVTIDLYELAMKFDPENSMAADWFADFYLQLSITDDAIKVLEKSFQSFWDPDLVYKLASLYLEERDRANEKKWEKYLSKAHSLMERLVEGNNEPEFMNLLGYILFLQEKFEEAEAVYVKCLDMEPEVDRGYFYLSKVYAGLEDYVKAEAAMSKALELQPKDPHALNELAIIYSMQERFDDALNWIEHALELHPDDLDLKYNRAIFLTTLGRLEEAAKELEEVFDLDEEEIFLELAMDDPGLLPLMEAGLFTQELVK